MNWLVVWIISIKEEKLPKVFPLRKKDNVQSHWYNYSTWLRTSYRTVRMFHGRLTKRALWFYSIIFKRTIFGYSNVGDNYLTLFGLGGSVYSWAYLMLDTFRTLVVSEADCSFPGLKFKSNFLTRKLEVPFFSK